MHLNRLMACIILSMFLLTSTACQSYAQFRGQLKSSTIDLNDTKPRNFEYDGLQDVHVKGNRQLVVLPFSDPAFTDVLVMIFTTDSTKQVAITGLPGAGGAAFLIPRAEFLACVDDQERKQKAADYRHYYDSHAGLADAITNGLVPGTRRMTGTAILTNRSDEWYDNFHATVDLQSSAGDVIKGNFARHHGVTAGDVTGMTMGVVLSPIWVPALILLYACGGNLVSI